jgi:chaperone modulatory protein CbpM
MTERYSEGEVIATVTRLTRHQLIGFIEGDLVQPERGDAGYVFRAVDIARLELLCDLTQDLEMEETALGIVLSLLDQLHAARGDLSAMRRAIDALPEEVKARILAAGTQP